MPNAHNMGMLPGMPPEFQHLLQSVRADFVTPGDLYRAGSLKHMGILT
jgi:hypothetical protein